MKHLGRILQLAMVLLALLPLRAVALPFVPTTDPTLSTNFWYFIETDGFR